MRVALLAILLSPVSRSTNIARVLHLIDAAASRDPGPDLVVVPGGCDRVTDKRTMLSAAMTDTYEASLCAKAREWGVYVAAAHQQLTNGDAHDVATMIDPDGDELFVHYAGGPAPGVDTVVTSVGSVGLSFEQQCLEGTSALVQHARAGDVLIAFGEPTAGDARACPGDATPAANAAEQGSLVCLVRARRGPGFDGEAIVLSDESYLCERMSVTEGQIVTAEVAQQTGARRTPDR